MEGVKAYQFLIKWIYDALFMIYKLLSSYRMKQIFNFNIISLKANKHFG